MEATVVSFKVPGGTEDNSVRIANLSRYEAGELTTTLLFGIMFLSSNDIIWKCMKYCEVSVILLTVQHLYMTVTLFLSLPKYSLSACVSIRVTKLVDFYIKPFMFLSDIVFENYPTLEKHIDFIMC
jgi:hypothetical protein